MPDAFRPILNILIFCVTVVAMFFFILYIADEVKNPEEGQDVARSTSHPRVICVEEPRFHCRADDQIAKSWMRLPEKEEELNQSAGSWSPGFADTLALNNAEVDYLAVYNARKGDHRLISVSEGVPNLGVFCTEGVPAFELNLEYELSGFSDIALEAINALERFAATYNTVMTLQPGYPHADICIPVFHYNDYSQMSGTPEAGTYDRRTFFLASDSLLPAIRAERSGAEEDHRKQPE